jgi:broad specificity phosphatase PhoE
MALYLLRHGETVWNREHRFQGRLDSPLTERGRDQARRYGVALRRLLGDAVPDLASSQLGRAVETLRLLCTAAGWPAEASRLDPDLQEISFGDFDGLTRDGIPGFAALEARYAAAGDSFLCHCPGGESWDEAIMRLDRALGRFDPAADTVVVMHSLSGKVLRGRALGLDRVATLALDRPQDAIYRIEHGVAQRLPAAPALLQPVG